VVAAAVKNATKTAEMGTNAAAAAVVGLLPAAAAPHRHDPVRQVKSFLNAVAVMDVNVHIQHAAVRLQQLQDCQHNIIDVAEP
jgi:hypothetical protein